MLTDLFADQVRARPEAVAVTCDGVSLTDRDAYRRHLVREGVTFVKLTPSYFGLIAALPTTANGKLDTRALRELQPDARGDRVASRNDLESTLKRVVADIAELATSPEFAAWSQSPDGTSN